MQNVPIAPILFIFVLAQYIFKILSVLVCARVTIIYGHIMNSIATERIIINKVQHKIMIVHTISKNRPWEYCDDQNNDITKKVIQSTYYIIIEARAI